MAHDHAEGFTNHSRAFAIGIALNLVYLVVEAVYGLIANSLSLVADAGHNLTDVLGLVLARALPGSSRDNPPRVARTASGAPRYSPLSSTRSFYSSPWASSAGKPFNISPILRRSRARP